ncbi:hypothetical protein ACQY0O_007821 [Thecaphora frezii]
MTSKTRGFVTAWKLDLQLGATAGSGPAVDAEPVQRYQTRTSGGKVNAIEWAPRYPLLDPVLASDGPDYIVLTDDQEGWIDVLQWDDRGLHEKANLKLPGSAEDGADEGASHAIWID